MKPLLSRPRYLLPGPRKAAGGASPVKAEINVTPLVDVVLVLLIIFMVITPYLQHGVDVVLPVAEHAQEAQARADDALIVSIAADGSLYLGTERVSQQRLLERLRPVIRADPDREILLEADQMVPFRQVRTLMTSLRSLGSTGLSLATEDEPEGGR